MSHWLDKTAAARRSCWPFLCPAVSEDNGYLVCELYFWKRSVAVHQNTHGLWSPPSADYHRPHLYSFTPLQHSALTHQPFKFSTYQQLYSEGSMPDKMLHVTLKKFLWSFAMGPQLLKLHTCPQPYLPGKWAHIFTRPLCPCTSGMVHADSSEEDPGSPVRFQGFSVLAI